MKRITNDNFKEFYPEIEKSLTNATFVAVDAEFSGLTTATGDDGANQSLFDSPAERYAKLRDDIQPFVAVQIGLTAFTHTKHDNEYSVECFQFHLLPRAFPGGNRRFLFQAASVEFLTSHDFDFNQFAYNAISYLDEAEEAKLRRTLQDSGSLLFASEFVPTEGLDEVDDSFKKVQRWLKDAPSDEKVLAISTSSFPVQYLMQKELRQTFKGIWTESQGMRNFSVIKVTADVRKSLEDEEIASKRLDDDLLNYYAGFSKVMRLMEKLRKPIVGHNLLLDLMFIYKQFFRPLPKRYESFKRSINELFPLVYDTKFLSYELKSVLHATSWKSNGLAELYGYFKDGPGRHLALNSPRIGTPGAAVVTDEKFHDAAWDSYCTGYCFIRMAHIYTVKKLSSKADLRIFTNAEIMAGVKTHANRINLIRADLSYLRLDNSDPASTRPRWLHVRTTSENACARQIAQDFSRFGPVDVRRHTASSLLVAVPNHGTAREILKHYASHAELRVAPYDSWSHSTRRVSVLVWAGSLILSGAGIAAWLLNGGSVAPPKPPG